MLCSSADSLVYGAKFVILSPVRSKSTYFVGPAHRRELGGISIDHVVLKTIIRRIRNYVVDSARF
jgi:hypothetical protein